MNAQHSSVTVEHYSPLELIEAARDVMGGDIHLDPATTYSVNKHNVKAHDYFTKDNDGLSRNWWGCVWLNPPGGRVGNKSSAAIWWNKLVTEYLEGRVQQAIFLGFSIEILATTQDFGEGRWIGDFPFCVPRARIDFLKEAEPGVFVENNNPTHANVIVFLPPAMGADEAVWRFHEIFSKFGRVR